METKEIIPKQKIDSEVNIPGSKSYANRALVIATLAKGTTKLTNVPSCDDVKYMIDVVKNLGVKVEKISDNEYDFTPPREFNYSGDVYVGFAGTTSRFLTTLMTVNKGKTRIYGEERIHQRPIEDLVEALAPVIDGTIVSENKTDKGERCFPLVIDSKGLIGGKIRLKGDTSSQFLTSVLLSAPYANQSIEVEIIGELTSKSYADMTVDIMNYFGVDVENNNYKNFIVPKQNYCPKEYFVEIDSTGAMYFLAITAIVGGKIKINNVNPNSVQGDYEFVNILERMGCKINKGADFIELQSSGELNAVEVNMELLPDSAQTLAVVASFAKGSTKITGLATLKVKETDRISAIKNELTKCGINVEVGEDYLIVEGGKPNGATISTYDDHRMAMSFAVMGAKISEIKIENPGCVSKSFPEFWELFNKI